MNSAPLVTGPCSSASIGGRRTPGRGWRGLVAAETRNRGRRGHSARVVMAAAPRAERAFCLLLAAGPVKTSSPPPAPGPQTPFPPPKLRRPSTAQIKVVLRSTGSRHSECAASKASPSCPSEGGAPSGGGGASPVLSDSHRGGNGSVGPRTFRLSWWESESPMRRAERACGLALHGRETGRPPLCTARIVPAVAGREGPRTLR